LADHCYVKFVLKLFGSSFDRLVLDLVTVFAVIFYLINMPNLKFQSSATLLSNGHDNKILKINEYIIIYLLNLSLIMVYVIHLINIV